MKKAYPVILTQGKKFVLAYIPDFDINTQGRKEKVVSWTVSRYWFLQGNVIRSYVQEIGMPALRGNFNRITNIGRTDGG